jgi:hypothetical protein
MGGAGRGVPATSTVPKVDKNVDGYSPRLGEGRDRSSPDLESSRLAPRGTPLFRLRRGCVSCREMPRSAHRGTVSTRDLAGAGATHNPKVAGSNPAPATMDDEGLADAAVANPFRLPRLHPGIGSASLSGKVKVEPTHRQDGRTFRFACSSVRPRRIAGTRP